MGIVILCVLISGLGVIWQVRNNASAALRGQLTERGVAIASSLASQSRDLVLTHNQYALYRLVKEAQLKNKDIAYIFVQDAKGDVLVHTFEEGFPVSLLEVGGLSEESESLVKVLRTEDGLIQDLAVPILAGEAGVMRIGMSETRIEATLDRYVRDSVVWVVLILALGTLAAYGLASLLTRPIARMVDATRALAKGDFQWRAPIWAKDEIGHLGMAFNDMSEKLKQKEEMRARLLAKVMSAQEEERKRISRELHDETGQALTSLMVGLKVIEGSQNLSEVAQKASELRATAAKTLDEVHNLTVELRPSALDDLGLEAALQRYLKDYSTARGINVDSHMGGIRGRRLLTAVETAIYRIVQEALTNVAKHAQAKNVNVILESREGSLVVIIEDDGIGFDVSAFSDYGHDDKRLGIFGMMERALLIGGRLTVESKPGVGTTIFLEVPLELSEGFYNE